MDDEMATLKFIQFLVALSLARKKPKGYFRGAMWWAYLERCKHRRDHRLGEFIAAYKERIKHDEQ